jgi:hypothetical protein
MLREDLRLLIFVLLIFVLLLAWAMPQTVFLNLPPRSPEPIPE